MVSASGKGEATEARRTDAGYGWPIEGSRVRLRDWTPGDLPLYESWIMPPAHGGEHEWQRTDGPFYPNFTAEGAQNWLGKLRADVQSGDWPVPRQTAIIADAADDSFIGQVSWYHWEPPSEDDGQGSRVMALRSLGVSIYPPRYWSGGYGTEALKLWVGYLFDHSDSHRLDLETWSGNAGMCRVAEKLGFTEEARIRRARMVRGELYDRMIYGILREEWERQR